MSLVDVNAVQKEVEKELRDEAVAKAKTRMKGKLREIETAKTVLANLEREYADMLQAIGDGN